MEHVLAALGQKLRAAPDAGLLTAGLAIDLMLWGGDATLRWGGAVSPLLVIATGATMFAVLANRRRHPFLAFGCAAGYTCLWSVVLLTYQPFVGLLIALFEIARRYPMRIALAFLAISAVPLSSNTADTVINTNAGASGAAATVAVWCTLTVIVWAAGRESRRSEVLARLREQKLAAEAQVALQTQRLQVARDLHDIVAHSVTLMVLQAAGAQRLQGRDEARLSDLLVSIESTGQQAMSELRQMLYVLRPPSPGRDGLSGAAPANVSVLAAAAGPLSGLAQMEVLAEHVRSAGLHVNVSTKGDSTMTLDAERDLIAYRVVQEGLTNASKHAGPGAWCHVDVTRGMQGVTIQVTDDAGGTPTGTPGSSGLGLTGLRERLTAVGGTLDTGATPARAGYQVTAWIPWPASNNREPAGKPRAAHTEDLLPPLVARESGLQGA